MRICVLTPTFLPVVGGVEIAIDQLVRAWRDRGHWAGVLAQAPRRAATTSLDLPYPVRHHPRPLSQRGLFLGARRRLSRWSREAGFDVVNAQMAYPAGFIACRWASRNGLPVVITCQGGDVSVASRYRRRPFILRRIGWCLRRADAVTAVSDELAAAVEGLSGGRRPLVVPNGVDLDVADPASLPESVAWASHVRGRRFLLYLKRLHPAKGHDVLLRAYARAREKRGDLPLLVIAGEGTERGRLAELTRDLGLEADVLFTGPVAGAAKKWLLQNCTIFVHPSRREGLPLVVNEAMACGRPILAARSEGLAAQVEEGRTGHLVDPDDAEALAGVLDRMLDAPNLREMGEAGRRKAEGLAWPGIARRYEVIFREVLELRGRAAPAWS